MIELYKRNIWNDTKTVNVISTACFSKVTKVSAVLYPGLIARSIDTFFQPTYQYHSTVCLSSILNDLRQNFVCMFTDIQDLA